MTVIYGTHELPGMSVLEEEGFRVACKALEIEGLMLQRIPCQGEPAHKLISMREHQQIMGQHIERVAKGLLRTLYD